MQQYRLLAARAVSLTLGFTLGLSITAGADSLSQSAVYGQGSAPALAQPAVSSGEDVTQKAIAHGSGSDGKNSEIVQLPLAAGSQLTLHQAISIALKYHPKAAEAVAESNAALEQVGEARSYLGPQVYGVTEYLRNTDNGIGNASYYNLSSVIPRLSGTNHNLASGDTTQTWSSSNSYIGGLAVSQYLLDFGRRRGLVDQRKFEASATAQQQQLVNLDLILEVSQRYFDLLKAKQLVRVFVKAVEERQFHLHEGKSSSWFATSVGRLCHRG